MSDSGQTLPLFFSRYTLSTHRLTELWTTCVRVAMTQIALKAKMLRDDVEPQRWWKWKWLQNAQLFFIYSFIHLLEKETRIEISSKSDYYFILSPFFIYEIIISTLINLLVSLRKRLEFKILQADFQPFLVFLQSVDMETFIECLLLWPVCCRPFVCSQWCQCVNKRKSSEPSSKRS